MQMINNFQKFMAEVPKDEIMYILTTEDVETTTQNMYGRSPTINELDWIISNLSDFIDHEDAISSCLQNMPEDIK